MSRYSVILSEDAEHDLQEYIDYIMYEYKAPITALRHYEALFDVLSGLKRSPESYPIQTRTSLLQYGTNVRRINYKRMAVIYTVHGDIVYIHRIVAGSMITGL